MTLRKTMHFLTGCLVALCLSLPRTVRAEETLVGEVYLPQQSSPLYLLRREQVTEGNVWRVRLTTVYPSLAAAQADGLPDEVAVVEEAVEEDGQIQSARIEQRQNGELDELQVLDGKLVMTRTVGGKTKSKTSRFTGGLVTGATVENYFIRRFEELQQGRKVGVDFALLQRLSVFDLIAVRVSQNKSNAESAVTLKLSSGNPFIAALLPKINFTMAEDPPHLLGYHGPLAVMRRQGKDWKTFDAEVRYLSAH